jgi:hypothetical protein
MAIRLRFFAASVLSMAVTTVAASTCGIERAILSGSELTILFQRSASYSFHIRLEDIAGKQVQEAEDGWRPVVVGINGIVLFVSGRDVQTRPYLRAPLNHSLVLSDHHFGCRARMTEDGQTLRVTRTGGTVGAGKLSVEEIQVEFPTR